MEDLEIFVMFGLNQPKKLKSFACKDEFYFYFAPPLPKPIVVFATFDKKTKITFKYELKLVIDQSLEDKSLGTLTNESNSVCWNGDWSDDEQRCAKMVQDDNRLVKLFATQVEESDNPKSNSEKTDQILQQSNIFFDHNKNNKEEVDENHLMKKNIEADNLNKSSPNIKDFFSRKVLKQTKKKVVEKENVSNFKDDIFDPFELPTDTQITEELKVKKSPFTKTCRKRNSPFASIPKQSKRCKSTNSPESPKLTKIKTFTQDKSPLLPKCKDFLSDEAPSGRWGHTFCTISDDKAVLLGGQGTRNQMNSDSLWILDKVSLTWRKEHSDNSSIDRRTGHSVCYDESMNYIYVYGGSKLNKWYNDVYTLDLKTWGWTKIETTGKAPTRAYHSCTSFENELLIFGGVYPNPDPTPDGCSNELLIFDKDNKSWYTPIVTGDKPSPRSGHSSCLIGKKLFIFAGWDAPVCFNDMFALDLGLMDYKKLTYIGEVPSARTWHCTALLSDRKRFCIYGGFDGDHVMNDVYLFNTGTLHWTKLRQPQLQKRTGHAAITCTCREDDDKMKETILVFGGGDNNGTFFDDIVNISI